MQATWRNVRKAVRNIPGAQGAQLSDVEAMADLCPSVVIVRNRHRCWSPLDSARQHYGSSTTCSPIHPSAHEQPWPMRIQMPEHDS